MEYEQEQKAQLLQDSNTSGDHYNNENGGYYDYLGDMDMSSSIASFGEPDLNEIAQQTAFSVFNLALNNSVQDDDDVEYDFFGGYEDVFMPVLLNPSTGPKWMKSWQVALNTINDALDEITHDDDGQEAR